DNFTDHFSAFDYTQTFGGHHQQHHHHQSAFNPSPPTPPNPAFGQHPSAVQQHQEQQLSGHSPSTNGSVNGSSSSMRGDGISGAKGEANIDDSGRGGSEDDDILTPAQSRRKAQNRAA
ncbi:bzip transcription factor fcr3, partial [Trichoderma arundinaceum]